jgi:hypothetical protein
MVIGHTGYFVRKFLMTAVMDKSEEEIIAAIKFYYQHQDPVEIVPNQQDESQLPTNTYPNNQEMKNCLILVLACCKPVININK